MLCSFYKNPLSKASFLLIFLAIACNQKPTQNAESKEEKGITVAQGGPASASKENTPDAAQKASAPIQALEGSKSPALIYGSNPTYVKVEKDEQGYVCNFVEDESINDPGMIDQTFKIDPKSGIHFSDFKMSNQYGLFFGQFPTKTKITICGTNSCSIVNHQELVVIKTTPEQFASLFSKAQAFKMEEIANKVWNLYFFDTTLKIFQSETPAKLDLTAEAILDWNGVLDQTGKVAFTTEGKNLIDLKFIQTEKPILVGKYKADDKELLVIGIEQFSIEKNPS